MSLDISTNNRNQNQPSFKGFETLAFATPVCTALQTDPIVENAVSDIGAMVAPRTVVDFTRGPDAGIETARRECSALTNNFVMPGVLGAAVGYIAGKIISKHINVDTTFAISSDTIDALHEAWKDNKSPYNCAKHVSENMRGLVGICIS